MKITGSLVVAQPTFGELAVGAVFAYKDQLHLKGKYANSTNDYAINLETGIFFALSKSAFVRPQSAEVRIL